MLISHEVPAAGQRPQRLRFRKCVTAQFEDTFRPQSVEQNLRGMSFRQALEQAIPERDRVTSTQRVNPAGDALLLNLLDKVPHDLISMTWSGVKRWVTHGDGAPEHLRENDAGYQIGREVPLEMTALLETLNSVMAEFPDLKPHISQEHTWSREAKSWVNPGGFWKRMGMAVLGQRPFPMPLAHSSKLFWALGIGVTNIVLPTGHETSLKEWMGKQPDASIELHSLFREAYRLNQGDLYGTLLSAENVLAEGLYDENRGDRPLPRKLSYLRSDSTPQGDNFAAWYHLMGSALYSLMRSKPRANAMMKLESAGSYILEGKDAQEDHINRLGVHLGAGLRKLAENGVNPNSIPRPYVNTKEFGWDRKSAACWTVSPCQI